jgi:RND family efflux transporter MFP subunit
MGDAVGIANPVGITPNDPNLYEKQGPLMPRYIRYAELCLALVVLLSTGPALAGDEASVLVQTIAVKSKEISVALEAYGTVIPSNDATTVLSVSHAGIVNRVWVRLGQEVKRGDALIDLDTSPVARRDFLQAQTAVDYARQSLARQRRLKKEQLTTSDQINAARKALKDAQNRLQSLKKLGQGKSHVVLRAPVDGIVTRLDVMQGQRISADATTVQIAAGNRLKVLLGVEPADAGRIKKGDKVSLVQVFSGADTVIGKVENIHAMINPATRLVDVLVSIPEKAIERLMIGGAVKGAITLDTHQALVIPGSSVLADKAGAYVFVVSGGRALRRNVETGLVKPEFTEILSGLKAGEPVVILGNYELQDAMPVREAQK